MSGRREARIGIGSWVEVYNLRRPHSAHGGTTPQGVFPTALPAPGLDAAGPSGRVA